MTTRVLHIFTPIVLAVITMGELSAQQTTVLQDTLKASIKIADWNRNRETGTRLVKPADFQTMVSATGEADVIKLIQTLPGIATGAEGSAAIYVRGGNIGSNLITLDGVPVYGSSHLLGFTSVYSPESIHEAHFMVGGFTSEEGNLTASHIQLTSATPDFDTLHWNASASNFILGGSVTAPIVEKKIAFTAAVRFSPIGAEYSLLKNMLPSGAKSISDASALVYDVFAKAAWRISPKHDISLSVFNSLDTYKYLYESDSEEHMRWNNLVLNLKHKARTDGPWFFDNGLSFNSFSSRQAALKILSETENNLAIGSDIKELILQTTAKRQLGMYSEFQAGFKTRYARFNPGSSSRISGGLLMHQESPAVGDVYYSSTNTLHAQLAYMNTNHLEMRAAVRANLYLADAERVGDWKARFDPEVSLLARWYPVNWFGIEGTFDWLSQYYHTLEGVPLGWSLDMIIPSDAQCIPEKSRQLYGGVFFSFGEHRFSIGGYEKKMNNLVFFIDATQLFSSAIAGWKDNIDVGSGNSHGLEFLYEKGGERFNGRIAYTLSKTDRNFPRINKGEDFPAKFDRTHILNATASFSIIKNEKREFGVNTLFTLQSGHWETVSAGSFYGYMIHSHSPVEVDWFSHMHNYRMPTYTRWDAGVYFKWYKENYSTSLNVGIYNILNRHNPFTVSYDPDSRQWKQISLLPIMPSIAFRVDF